MTPMGVDEIAEVILHERYGFPSDEAVRELLRLMVREVTTRALELWMGGRADDRTGLESRGPREGSEGSNPSPSADVV